MAKIVGPSIKKTYTTLIKNVIADLGKPVSIFLPPEKADCPNCIWDPVNQSSTNTFDSTFVAPISIFGQTINPQPFTRGRCPVCKGIGYLKKDIVRPIKALVKWQPSGPEDLEILPAGREGISIVRLKALPTHYNNFKQALYFIVDGVRCEILTPPAIRALGTTEGMVVVYLQEVEIGKDTKKT